MLTFLFRIGPKEVFTKPKQKCNFPMFLKRYFAKCIDCTKLTEKAFIIPEDPATFTEHLFTVKKKRSEWPV